MGRAIWFSYYLPEEHDVPTLPTMNRQPELSVVLLCYRGGEHIVPYVTMIHRELTANIGNFELILVANYDANTRDDKTPDIAATLARQLGKCASIAEPKKGRMGWDLRQGLARSHGKYISFLDGDGQTPPDDIVRLLRLMKEQDTDLCKSYRVYREDTQFRRAVSVVFNALFHFFFPTVRVRDINAKPKILTRRAYSNMCLTSNDWFVDAEIILEAMRLNLKVSEMPSITTKNNWRKSFIGLPAIFEFLKNMVFYRILYWFFRK